METTQNKPNENFKITGNWDAQSKKLKEQHPELTDADLQFEPGKENELITRLQSRLKLTHEQVVDAIKSVNLEKV